MKKRKVLIASGLLCLGLACAWWMGRSSPAPPPIQLFSPNQLPPQRVPLSIRVLPIGPRWAWVWRWRQKLLGPSKPVTIEVSAIRTASWTDAWSLLQGKPDVIAPDGLRVWNLNAAELDDLRRQLQRDPDVDFCFRPTLGVSDGNGATMMCSRSGPSLQGAPTQVGLRIDARPKIHGQVTDLIASILWNEAVTNPPSAEAQPLPVPVVSIQTNLCVAGRFQLSNACGVFLLHPAASPGQGRYGLLICARQGSAPGQRLQQAIRKR